MSTYATICLRRNGNTWELYFNIQHDAAYEPISHNLYT